MKKLMLLCAMIAFALSSCSDDTNKNCADVSGSYQGLIVGEIGGVSLGTPVPLTITIANTGEKVVKLTIADFSYNGIQMGEIALDNVRVTCDGNETDLDGVGTVSTVIGDVNITADGEVIVDALSLDLDVLTTLGMVELEFNGMKQ